MQTSKRKREVSSCIPCYTRKQKCDRQYPCNRCSRRRRPELCSYTTPQTQTLNLREPFKQSHQEDVPVEDDHWQSDEKGDSLNSSPTLTVSGLSQGRRDSSSLARDFGHDDFDELNTMALVRKLVHKDDNANTQQIAISNEVATDLYKTLDTMLGRPTIDFLVRYFVTELNWIDQLLHPPCFLQQYQRWWSLGKICSVADVEFAILFLRICCYTVEFLPSPAYTGESIKGMALSDVRKSCEHAIAMYTPICTRLDPRGSLTRIQHIEFAGLVSFGQGQMNACWEFLGSAARVAQRIGLHLDTTVHTRELDEVEKEMRRRTFCNLYIWDSGLSKRLDRMPFLSDDLSEDTMPRMHLFSGVVASHDIPDVFTARVLQSQLSQFWRSHTAARSSEFDILTAEENYDQFCSSFLGTMPSVLALQPDKQWDELHPTLPMQRQLLHIAIFEFLCWNFKATLLQTAEQLKQLPVYKQILMSHSKRVLAVASLKFLENVFALHMMVGGFHVRFPSLVILTFEAAVPLLCLYADTTFTPDVTVIPSRPGQTDPLGGSINNVTRAACLQAAKDALSSLQTLVNASDVAALAVQTLTQLIARVDTVPALAQPQSGFEDTAYLLSQASTSCSCEQISDYTTRNPQSGLPFANIGYTGINLNWVDALPDVSNNVGLDGGAFVEPANTQN